MKLLLIRRKKLLHFETIFQTKYYKTINTLIFIQLILQKFTFSLVEFMQKGCQVKILCLQKKSFQIVMVIQFLQRQCLKTVLDIYINAFHLMINQQEPNVGRQIVSLQFEKYLNCSIKTVAKHLFQMICCQLMKHYILSDFLVSRN